MIKINDSIKQAQTLVDAIEKGRDLFYELNRQLLTRETESEVKFRVETMWHLMIISLNDAREMLKFWKQEKLKGESDE